MARRNEPEVEQGPSSIDTLHGAQNTTPRLKRGESLKDFGINRAARQRKKDAAKKGPVDNSIGVK